MIPVHSLGSPGGSNGKESAHNVQGLGLIPWRREWQPTPVLEYSVNRGAWLATVHGVAKNQTQLST